MGEIAHEPLGLRVHDGRELLGDPGKLAGVGHHHAQESEIFRLLVQLQNHPRDQTQHLLDIALSFDAGRESVLELTRHPEEHLPEDLLLAGELVVERPPGHAGGLGQLVHAHRAEAAFQEQARGGLDDGLPRPAATGTLASRALVLQRQLRACIHAKFLIALLSAYLNILHRAMHDKR